MNESDMFRAERPRWAWAIRDWMIRYDAKHSHQIASHQAAVHHPWLDQYFLYSSVLGTHTFFMLFLPIFYLMIGAEYGRRRFTVGSHHLEYGFPSTHSANAVGMSVFLYNCLLKWRVFIAHAGTGVPQSLLEKVVMNTYVMEVIISLYVFTIVYGRIYSGMHSVLDCAVGSLAGFVVAFLTLKFDHLFGLFLENPGLTDVVAFDGSLTGVALGEWIYNTILRHTGCGPSSSKLGAIIPANYLTYIKGKWLIFIARESLLKVAVTAVLCKYHALTSGVTPIVLWKVFMSPVIKQFVLNVVMAFTRPAKVPSTGTSVDDAKAHDVNSVPETLRNRKAGSMGHTTAPSEPQVTSCSEELNPFAKRVYQGKPYGAENADLDTYRFIVYTGIGMIGSGVTRKMLTCLGVGALDTM